MRNRNSDLQCVKNVFRRAMEAKKYLYLKDGNMPQEVRDLCFPGPEIAPEVIDDWNRNHSRKEELIDKFVLRNTLTGDFSSARIILLDNCVPAEYPGEFTKNALLDAMNFWYGFGVTIEALYDAPEKSADVHKDGKIEPVKLDIYGKSFHSFPEFWQFELHTLQNTGLLDAFYPVADPVCSAEENYNRYKLTGRRGVEESRAKIAELQPYFAQIAWFTFDLDQFTEKTNYCNFGNEIKFVKTPYYNYFKKTKKVVLEKVRNAMAENKIIICRNELALWHREIDFSGYENFFYLYNPALPVCRGNVGKGCDLSARTAADPFDELVKACSPFLK